MKLYSWSPILNNLTNEYYSSHIVESHKRDASIFPCTGIQENEDPLRTEEAEKPCTDCTVTWMQAGLEYPDGSHANANTSLWLHHTFLVNTNRVDSVCGADSPGERFFASGNEREAADITVNGTNQAGYYLGPSDNVGMFVELMNQDATEQTAFLTITYEYVPSFPAQWYKVNPVWLDIQSCNGSEAPAQANATFVLSMQPPWTSNFTGGITSMIGHLHDGGTHIEMTKNNTVICDCVATYGQNPAYMDASNSSMMSMPGMPASGMQHISSISTCDNGTVNVGDRFSVNAYYNTSEYSPMLNTDGSLTPIMGISLFYVAVNETGSTSTGTTTGSSSTITGSSAVATSTSAAVALNAGIVVFAGSMVGMVAAFFM
ncbi:hypothetical protein LTR16_000398 [Cryomyces antarcticus]|uniref:Uncharacterized protein n=1 Tax=Cryomyces antarcticus TaxID=329879 RepID=A0ABR0M290_9PEZI|nr:hypothetical protein LTR39_000265 [Cryomyces antarcticus]KAK5257528.1 hypothetical protein LTR16_000398 [Cryomyces antarcticus]